MREREDFRPILERLDARFPNMEELNTSQVGAFLGCCRQTASKRYPFENGRIQKVKLARIMAGGTR